MGMKHEHTDNESTEAPPNPLARGLGALSLGLGVACLTAPRAIARLGGVDDSTMAPAVLRMAGVRELAHAAALLGSGRPGGWAWTRVAGDAADLAALAVAVRNRQGDRRRRASLATAAVAGITLLDLLAAVQASRSGRAARRALRLRAAITVNRPSDEVYRFWRDFENLPGFMSHLESVQVDDYRHSRWTAKGPAGRTVEWDAEIVEDRPDELIAWRSMPGATVPNSGRVGFVRAAAGRGTEIRVELEYDPPAGAVGRAVAKLFGEEPEQQVNDDLRRFKQVIETGEVVRSDGSPDGTNLRQQMAQRPAQPVAARLAR